MLKVKEKFITKLIELPKDKYSNRRKVKIHDFCIIDFSGEIDFDKVDTKN